MIKCSRLDLELIDAAQKEYPNADIIEEDSFSGEEWITIAIPLLELSITIVDFLLVHLSTSQKTDHPQEDVSKKRVIINKNKELSLYNYSAEEVVNILKGLGCNFDD